MEVPALVRRTEPGPVSANRAVRSGLAAALILVAGAALASPDAVRGLRLDTAASLEKLATGVAKLARHAEQAVARDGDPALQKAVVREAGNAVSRAFELYDRSGESGDSLRRAREVLLANRALLRALLDHNEAVIRRYQEQVLDEMADTRSFFLSPAWQGPQEIISLASYWIGWNGYYAASLLDAQSQQRKALLEEAVEGFSRAFIDFSEDEVTTKSLYGRGLVYRQLALYGRAALDFASVKQKLDREDPLYLQCLYQEALIAEASGKPELALSLADALARDYPGSQIPEPIRIGVKRLGARLAAGTGAPGAAATAPAGADPRVGFMTLKRSAEQDPALRDELYRYAVEQAASLAGLDPPALGAVGTLAVADWHFAESRHQAAAALYQTLLRDNAASIRDRMDRVRFRLGYLAAQQQNWQATIGYLRDFPGDHPRSGLLRTAVEQYYAAAVARHGGAATDPNYTEFIRAAGQLVRHCRDCAVAGDAQFALGRHHQRVGDTAAALTAFRRVPPANRNYPYASLQVVVATLGKLEQQQAQGAEASGTTPRDYQALRTRFTRQRRAVQAGTAQALQLRPHWSLAEARFHLLDFAVDPAAALKALEIADQAGGVIGAAQRLRIAGLRALALGRLGDADAVATQFGLLSATAGEQRLAYPIMQSVAARLYAAVESAAAARAAYAVLASLPDTATDPDERTAVRLRLAELHRRLDQPAPAVAVYEALLREAPESGDALRGLGQAYEALGRFDLAIAPWRRLSDALPAGSPDWFEARYHTALALQHLDRADKACGLATMTLVLHPDSGGPERAAQFLEIRRRSCPQTAG